MLVYWLTGIVLYLLAGFIVTVVRFYDEETLADEVFIGLIILWPFTLLVLLWRAIVFLARSIARASYFIVKGA